MKKTWIALAVCLALMAAGATAAEGDDAEHCVHTLEIVVEPGATPESIVLTVDGASRPLRARVREALALDFCASDVHHVRVNGAVFDVVAAAGSSGARGVALANVGFADGVRLSRKGVVTVDLAQCTFAPENKYYFEQHERFQLQQLLKNPMVMMCAPALLMLVMPKLVDKKEVAELLNYPLVSRSASFFRGAERRFDCLPDVQVQVKPIAVARD